MPSCRDARGFTTVELLVVIVIIGVVSAIGIPTLLNGLDRGRQKRTMGDIRTIGLAIQAYVVDNDLYPAGADIDQLRATLGTQYMPRLPRLDGWGSPFVYSGSATVGYTLGSAGKNGGTTLSLLAGGGPTGTFDADIIYANGAFLQWPDGAQID